MTNFEQQDAPFRRLHVADGNVEDLLRELNDRNPRALTEELRNHLNQHEDNGDAETTPSASRIETIGRMMEEKAIGAGRRGRTEEDTVLLADTLDELNLTMNDLSIEELSELGDIEAGLYQRYMPSNEEENYDE
ncbi:MAG: hypothetical protein ACREGE_01910 [Candidatus Microsaccharimonas sp.]